MKIKIISNYQYDELYSYSKSFYKDLGYEMIGIKGKGGFYGMLFFDYLMKDENFEDCDWIIYVDEDCFITNTKAMLELLEYQISNNIHCSGVPDGGIIWHRGFNPISINAFFMIINLGEVRKNYNSDVALSMKYDHDLDKYIPYDLINVRKKQCDMEYREVDSYYGLFFWMLRNNYKILYLDAYDYPNDEWTTVIKNHKNVDFAYHTWYAREWKRAVHKKRILNVIDYCNKIKE
jgi:hypothetical protein